MYSFFNEIMLLCAINDEWIIAMKYQIPFLLLCVSIPAFSQTVEDQVLPEVVVKSNAKIEKADKTVWMPTELEKKHAVSGFDLLGVMQIPELEISADAKKMTTKTGGEVVVCVNGMEVSQEEVATLLSKHIRKIEYIRAPDGKYAGKAGLVNIITRKTDFGGNVYLSAKEGFTYANGDYTAFADYTRKKLTFSLTASGDWVRNHSYTEGTERVAFSDRSMLTREFSDAGSLKKNNNQAVRFKLASTGEKHKFNSYVALVRQEQPSAETRENTWYAGRYDNEWQREVNASGKNLSPSFYANYSVCLPHSQQLDMTGSATWGNNDYSSQYMETLQTPIQSVVDEDSYSVQGKMMYAKSFKNSLKLSATASYHHTSYKDTYKGTSAGSQKLITDVSMGTVQLSRYGKRYFYYASAGVSNSAVRLNSVRYNYCNPVAFYGGNYAFSHKHSLNLNGYYVHTLFDPSIKNSMTIPISFFESVKGNPDIAPLKAFGNILSYNGQFGNFMFNASYNGYMYFDNIVHQFYTDEDRLYDTRINDGTFYGNMLMATLSYAALENRLRLSATAIEEYNMMRGEVYDLSKNIVRAQFSATYLWRDWMIKFHYRTPYRVLDIREPYFASRKPVYELQVGWNHKSWSVETKIRNPFSRYDENHVTMDYGCYRKDIWEFSEPNGCNVSLRLTYSFSYGKKTEREDTGIEKSIQSAIMKSY